MDKGKRQLQTGGTRARLKGVFAAVLLMLCCTVFASAQNTSGEYVWYEDHTFKRKSYIGFLYYDDKTLLMRYYAPFDAEAGLAERCADVYVTTSGGALTGERVSGVMDEEGISIVNYLHDLYYGISLVKRAAGDVVPFEERTKKAEMDVFGGEAVVTFDAFIPVFDVKRIQGNDNSVLFEAVTAGRLNSQEDTSFSDFHGFNSGTALQETLKGAPNARKIKKGKILPCAVTSADMGKKSKLRFTLDLQWKRSMENMWLLGDDAMVTVTEMGKLKEEDVTRCTRRLMQSTANDYIDYRALFADRGKKKGGSASSADVFIKSVTVQEDGTRVFTHRILRKAGEGWYLFTLTAFYETYLANRTYFDGITSSLKGE